MPDVLVGECAIPFESASEMRHENAMLLEELDRRLGQDSRVESEAAALTEIEPRIRLFLERGVSTGAFIEDIRERTACQVLLDYWASSLARAGVEVPRVRLARFDAARLPDLKDKPCPFVGLDAFRDSAFFFGREKAVESLLERLATTPLVVVQGASGCGKSSLVMAGTLPKLRAADSVPQFRIIGPFTPSNAGLERLVGAVASAVPDTRPDVAADVAAMRTDPRRLVELVGGAGARPVLLVIDQFEEVFTLCAEADRTTVAASIAELLRARQDDRVILTLREEFSDRLEELVPLRPHFARHARFSMKEWPMGYEDLKAAVERPAALVNLQFQPGIVDEMVKSVLGRETALPLLQFALRSLWEQRDRNRITHEVYARIGGSPLAALERFADGFYEGLPREQKDEVERILLDLVQVGPLLEPYRQPVLRSRLLDSGTPRTPEMLDLLADKDFVRITPTADRRDAAVEVKHESLLRNWPRYIGWINGKRERVRQRIALADAANRWDSTGRKASERLLGAWQVQEVKDLADLSGLEKEYVQASIEALDRAQRQEDKRRRVGRRLLVVIAALIVSLAGVAYKMKTEAQLAAQREVLLSVAAARQDLAQGKIHHALTGALQAINAAHIEQNSEDHTLRSAAHAALRSVLGETADLRRLFIAEDEVFQAVAFLPGRSEPVVAFAGSGGKTYLAGLEKPFSQTLDTCGAGLVTALAFDPRGQWLAAACADGSLSLWSSTNWQLLGRKHVLDKKIWTLAFSRDSRLVAAGGYENQVMLIAVGDDGRPQEPAPLANGDMPAGYVWSLVFSPRNDTLLVGDGVGRVLSCTAPVRESWTCGVSRAYRIAESTADAIRAIEFSPDGASVAVGLWTGRVKVSDAWDLATQSPIPIDVSQEPGPVHSLTSFEKDGCRYLAIGKGTRLLYRSMVGPEQQARADFDACIGRLNASVGDEVYSMAFHGPSGLLAAATRGGYVAILDPARRTMQSRALVPMPLKMGNPVRGAIVAEEGATTRLAVTLEPTEPENFNLALLTLRDGLLADSSGVLPLAAGSGKIRRVSGSAQSRRLATLTPGSDTLPTPPVVTVWRFDQDFKGVTPVLSLGTDDFDGLTPRRIALSPDGQRLVVAFEPPGEQTADEFQRERARKLLLVAVGADGGKTWLDTNLQSVREIAFSADGTLFAAGGGAQQGSDADEVKLWSVDSHGIEPTKLPPMVLSPSVYKVYDLAFAADPENVPLLVAGGDYGQIDIWSALTGNKIKTLRADSRPIYQLAFSSGGSLLAAADNQNVIRIWDTSQWTLMQLTPPTDPFETPGFLAFGRNGAWLMSGARALQLWDLDIDSLRHKACALLREPGQHGADMPTPMWRKNGCDAP